MAKLADRVRNWRKYNEALVKRGSITFWFDPQAIKEWHEKPAGNRGRPRKYSDTAMICGLTLKAIFKLTFRAVEGFINSLVTLLKLSIEVPDYTSLCKRQKTLSIPLPKKPLNSHEKINIVVDTTGLKVYGEGEWKVRQHGYVKHRLWRKLHLAVNSKTQEIEAFELTDLGVQDFKGLETLVKKIDKSLDHVIGDGAYDCYSCYELGEQKQFVIITPPHRNNRTSEERPSNKKKASPEAVKKRDDVIKKVRNLGRAEWKKSVGYHQRSLAETAMFRIKTLLGNRLSTKTMVHQQTEAAIWCLAINKMTSLGLGFV
jgi:hypothetical protein